MVGNSTLKKMQGRKAFYSSASQKTWGSVFRKKTKTKHKVLVTAKFLAFVKFRFILLIHIGVLIKYLFINK